MDQRVQAAIDLIAIDLRKRIDLTALALTVGVSPSGLRLLFQRNVGLPPSKYLKQLRFEHARQLLSTGGQQKSVKEVMAAVGYDDASHFVRDFEKMFGKSPKRYRDRYMKKKVAKS